jgi:hypothetical protein
MGHKMSLQSDPIARCFAVVDISFKDCGVSFTSCSFERPPASITDRIIGASSLPLLLVTTLWMDANYQC